MLKFKFLMLFYVIKHILGITYQVPNQEEEKDFDYWHSLGIEDMEKFEDKINKNTAKNVILFVGDGFGVTVNTAARIYKGQRKGHSGEEERFIWDEFPNLGFLKTYNLDHQVGESGTCATSFVRGVKGNKDTIGMNGKGKLNDCLSSLDPTIRIPSILHWAQKAGKDTGFVTTTRVTHATPASLYAYSAFRRWECDSDLIDAGQDSLGCKDIARQLIEDEPGKNLKVILGGGTHPLGVEHPINNSTSACKRSDGRNLINDWINQKNENGLSHAFVDTLTELEKVDTQTDSILGLFGNSHIGYKYYNDQSDNNQYPSLATMTKIAIKRLQNNLNGYFLMVEGGLIDIALHYGKVKLAFEEVMGFEEAVSTAVGMVDLEDTLIIILGDHSHAMTLNGGDPVRGNDILGLVHNKWAADKLPYTTLTFATGPGYNFTAVNNKVLRGNVSEEDTTDPEYTPQTLVPMMKGVHGGEDVPVFATGPWSHLFYKVHEQTYVAHVMAKAMKIGPFTETLTSSAQKLGYINQSILFGFLLAYLF